jgi:hypothetical protein
MKTLIILISMFFAFNLSAMTKFTPAMEGDSVSMFFYLHFTNPNTDSIILEPMYVNYHSSLITNFDEVGSSIYTHPHWKNMINEYCKEKYKKSFQSEYCYVEKVGNITFIIFQNSKNTELLYALLTKYKNEEITATELLAYIP